MTMRWIWLVPSKICMVFAPQATDQQRYDDHGPEQRLQLGVPCSTMQRLSPSDGTATEQKCPQPLPSTSPAATTESSGPRRKVGKIPSRVGESGRAEHLH
jgi:hypothetical protein